MSNVWGSGGLFEQALASKLAGQAAETELNQSKVGVDAMNASTNRLNANNQYDLGLRKDAVEQGQLGVNRGQLDVNRMTAQTGQFNADTARLDGFNQFGKAAPDSALISSLGLRTVNPYTPSAGASVLPSDQGSSMLKTTQANGVAAFGDRTTQNFKNGGVVLKPKMKQPGHSAAKVQMPRGYKNGGKIGDVAKDDGTDKVNVVARQGEYFLNPETVAAGFGGGSYEAGVRNLNQIVRDATGKEPGPSPVGKSGKPGFVYGGALGDEFPRNAPVTPQQAAQSQAAAQAAARQSAMAADPNMELYRRAALDRMAAEKAAARSGATTGESTIHVGANGTASTTGLKNSYAAAADADVGQSIRSGAAKAYDAVKRFVPSVATTGKYIGRAGNFVAAPIALGADVADVVDVYTDPNMSGRDVAGEVASKAGKWGLAGAGALKGGAIGAAIGGPFAPITGAVGSILGGVGGYIAADKAIEFGRGVRGVDTRDSSEYSNGIVSQMLGSNDVSTPLPSAAAAGAKPAEQPKPRDFDKEVRDKLAESEAKAKAAKNPSLRDMMMERYTNLHNGLAGADAMKTITSLNQMKQLEGSLVELDKNAATAGARTAKDQEKAVEGVRKQMQASFQRPVLKDGEPTGATEFDEGAFNLFEASVIAPLAEQGIDFYNLPPAIRMQEVANYQNRRRVSNDIYAALSGVRDAPISRELINPNQIAQGPKLGFRQLNMFNPQSSVDFGDMWDSMWRGGDYDETVQVTIGGKKYILPKTIVSRMPNGSLDIDGMRQYNRKPEEQ